MNIRILSLAIGSAAALALAGGPAGAAAPQPESFGALTASLLPAVVNISTTQTVKPDHAGPEAPEFPPGSPFEQFFKDFMDRQGGQSARPHKSVSLGSGFIIDSSGLVVTNNHVISEGEDNAVADEITVILQDDTHIKAELVGRDVKTDLALLRVKTDHKLVSVPFGDSDRERVGDWVVAVGNPYGLGGTVTAGILSARSRAINNNGPYDDFLQTDAAINRGNSGGPLFNLAGEVIGINSAIFSPGGGAGGSVGIGFAIPSDLAQLVIGQLKTYGRVRRGYLGARIQEVSAEAAEDLGLDKPAGALVAGVLPDSPAQKAGLEPGDVVLAVDGKPVADLRHLERAVADSALDQDHALKVWRARAAKELQVRFAEADQKEEQVASIDKGAKPGAEVGQQIKALGLTLAPVTPDLKERFQLDDSATVVITGVAHSGPAADKDLKAGDVVVEVAQEAVKDLADVTRKIDEARKARKSSVLMLIDRGGELHFVAIKIDAG